MQALPRAFKICCYKFRRVILFIHLTHHLYTFMYSSSACSFRLQTIHETALDGDRLIALILVLSYRNLILLCCQSSSAFGVKQCSWSNPSLLKQDLNVSVESWWVYCKQKKKENMKDRVKTFTCRNVTAFWKTRTAGRNIHSKVHVETSWSCLLLHTYFLEIKVLFQILILKYFFTKKLSSTYNFQLYIGNGIVFSLRMCFTYFSR